MLYLMKYYEYQQLNNEELNEKLNSMLIEQRVDAAFIEIPSAIGMSNHEGSKATISLQLMKDLARILRKKNKYFFGRKTFSKKSWKKSRFLFDFQNSQKIIFFEKTNVFDFFDFSKISMVPKKPPKSTFDD